MDAMMMLRTEVPESLFPFGFPASMMPSFTSFPLD
jgi:hypothetical protein